MTLREFLEKKKITIVEFCSQTGLSSHSVRAFLDKNRFPNYESYLFIKKATSSEVTEFDFAEESFQKKIDNIKTIK